MLTQERPGMTRTDTAIAATLDERYQRVKQRVADAAARARRRADEVVLIAVTKHAEPDDIHRLLELGHADFGENRVQQLVQRAAMVEEWTDRVRVLPETAVRARQRDGLRAGAGAGVEGTPRPAGGGPIPADLTARWHMIGHLQRNKARKVVECVRLIHSVDSLRIAEELQGMLERTEKKVDVLLQVNVSGEESKFGCPLPAAAALAEQIDHMYNLRLRGLMTMAPHSEDPEEARPHFARLRELFEEFRREGFGEGRLNVLSMGMSGDFEVAIEEGANMVRVGSAIFGERAEAAAEDEAAG